MKLCSRIIQIIHTVGQKLYIPLSVYSKFHMIASTNPTQIFTAHVLACLHYRLNFGEDWWRIAKFLYSGFLFEFERKISISRKNHFQISRSYFLFQISPNSMLNCHWFSYTYLKFSYLILLGLQFWNLQPRTILRKEIELRLLFTRFRSSSLFQ